MKYTHANSIQSFFMRMVFLFLLLCTQALFGEVANQPDFKFEAPKGWKNEKKLPEGIMAIYLGQTKSLFRPSINIACEKTKLDLSTYTEKTISIHSKDPSTICREIGSLTTKAGTARLLQIETQANFGKIQFLQAIILKDQMAYVITATSLKEDFANYSLPFYKSIKTFSLE